MVRVSSSLAARLTVLEERLVERLTLLVERFFSKEGRRVAAADAIVLYADRIE